MCLVIHRNSCLSYSFIGGWIFQDKDKSFYGMAINGNSCSKVGIDSDGPEVTPETRNFTPDPKRERLSIEFFSKYLPKVHTAAFYVSTYCLSFLLLTQRRTHLLGPWALHLGPLPSLTKRGTEQNAIQCSGGFLYVDPPPLHFCDVFSVTYFY